MSFIKKDNALIFLFINSLLWGSSYVWSKMLLSYIPRFTILFLCALGSLVATSALFPGKLKNMNFRTVGIVSAISVLSIISNTFFMLALQHTSSSNTAFIVQTSVILTPAITAVLNRKKPGTKTILSSIAALIGMFFITCDFKTFSFNTGDLLAFCNALFFSAFLVALSMVGKKSDPVQLSIIQQAANTIGFFALALVFEYGKINIQSLAGNAFIPLLGVSVAVAASTVLLQSTAIRYVSPEKATIIYTIEPVAALVLAAFFIGEKPEGWGPALGCVIVLGAVLWSVHRPVKKRKLPVKFGDDNKMILESTFQAGR